MLKQLLTCSIATFCIYNGYTALAQNELPGSDNIPYPEFSKTIYVKSDNTILYRTKLRSLMPNNPLDSINYTNVITALKLARSSDIVMISINSPGGAMILANNLVDAIKETKAGKIMSYIEYNADSAASIFPFLYTNVYYTLDSSVMYHLPKNAMPDGTITPLPPEEQITVCNELRDIYHKLPLTLEQVVDYCKGEDIYVNYYELESFNKHPCNNPNGWCLFTHK